jgi:hypothetical protein
MRCRACGYAGAPPAGIEARLRAAGQALLGLEVRRRQLSSSQRRMVVSGRYRVAWFLGAAFVVGAPFACCGSALLTASVQEGRSDYVGVMVAVMFVAPAVIMAAVIAVALWLVARRAEALRAAMAAIPAAVPGEPAACHVCGGPVPVDGVSPFSRCGFCAADNLVTEGALARNVELRVTQLDGYAAAVQRDAAGVGAQVRRAVRLVFLGALGAPVLGVGGTCCIYLGLGLALGQAHGPTHAALRYAWRDDAERGRCLAVADPHETDTVAAEALVGRRVARESNTIDGRPLTGRVVAVYGTPIGFNGARLDIDDDGPPVDVLDVAGLCLADE